MSAQERKPRAAPGQLLGYALQLPRALCRLMQVGPGGAVGVEVLGDVTVYFPDGSVVDEEDKSGTTRNPLADRSASLWKTFRNWISCISDGALTVDASHFVLYCNQRGNRALVDDLDCPVSVLC